MPLALALTQGLFKDGLDFDRLAVLRGTGSLWINNQKVAEQKLEYPIFAVWEGLDIGRDQITSVSPEYQSPYSFREMERNNHPNEVSLCLNNL